MRPVRVALAVVALVVAWDARVPGANAANTVETGWWSRRVDASAQPAGGFEIGWSIDGEESVAAVRLTDDVVTTGRLHLVLTAADPDAQVEDRVAICVAASDWKPANPGPWDARPTIDCDGAADVGDDGRGRWVADVTALVDRAGPRASLAVVPVGSVVQPGLPLTAPFRLTFAAASLNSTEPTPREVDAAPPTTVTSSLTPPPETSMAPPPPVAAPSPDSVTEVDVPAEIAPEYALPIAGSAGDAAPWLALGIAIPAAAMLTWTTVNGRRDGRSLQRVAAHAGEFFVAAGVVAVWLGWRGAARSLAEPLQWPWMVSGGLGGLALVVLGIGLARIEGLRRDAAHQRDALDQALAAAAAALDSSRHRSDRAPRRVLAAAGRRP